MHLRPFLALSSLALACTAPAAPISEPPVSEPTRAAPTSPERLVEPAPPPSLPPPNPVDLVWSLTVQPSAFALPKLERVRVVLTAHNEGDKTTHPLEFRPHDMRVDGDPSMALSVAFGNGLTGPRWSSLPGGESATDARVGVAFVDTPGKHVISAHRGDEELARVTVTVRP